MWFYRFIYTRTRKSFENIIFIKKGQNLFCQSFQTVFIIWLLGWYGPFEDIFLIAYWGCNYIFCGFKSVVLLIQIESQTKTDSHLKTNCFQDSYISLGFVVETTKLRTVFLVIIIYSVDQKSCVDFNHSIS